ncbi:MAG TPA: nuclear transport factor 2 family protein [Gemmatimonadales bacterium]|nr:nuclear transport factor 2 family protein [Gemmatimonadales bacterium]
MDIENEVSAAEDRFFEALLLGDRSRLDQILDSDFLLIDVMTGSEVPKAGLLDVVGSGQLVFEAIARIDASVRSYDGTAVVTGQTRMKGQYGGVSFSPHSRYTHVYVRGAGGWRLVSAQGTPIAPGP